jgi:hypothetical protein
MKAKTEIIKGKSFVVIQKDDKKAEINGDNFKMEFCDYYQAIRWLQKEVINGYRRGNYLVSNY